MLAIRERPPIAILEVEQDVLVAPKTRSPFDPDIYKREEDVGKSGIPYYVRVLDEQLVYVSDDGNTARIRQYILGHHDTPLLRNARMHNGWQGDEMIREFYRLRLSLGNGNETIVTREINLNPPNQLQRVRYCSRTGVPL